MNDRNLIASALLAVAVCAGMVAFLSPQGTVAADPIPGVGTDGSIAVPKADFRKDWAYLGAFVVSGEDGVGDMHAVYTQPATVEAYRRTGAYPDGAVLVKELYKTKSDDLTTGRASWAAEPAGWFVMVKDTQNRFPNNPLWGDGWGWAFFNPDDPDRTVTTNYVEDCLGCHEPARATDLSYTMGYPTLTGPSR